MQKAYNKIKTHYLILSLFVLLLIFLYLFLQPHLSRSIFPYQRDELLSTFTTKINNTKHVDTRESWELREFYSPGYFTYNNRGININNIPSPFRFVADIKTDDLFPFLVYFAPLTQSVDYLTTLTTIEPIIKNFPVQDVTIILQTNKIFLAQKEKTLFLIFLAPYEDLKQTNGFLNYQEKDKELTKGKQWLSLTRFQM